MKFREFWIAKQYGDCGLQYVVFENKPSENDSIAKNHPVIHVVEAGPVLAKIARLESALLEISTTNADNPFWAKVVAQAALGNK